MAYTIVKQAPLPAPKGAGRDGKYPFGQMVADDAFYIPIDAIEPAETTILRVRGAAGVWARRNRQSGVRFMVRKAPHPDTAIECIGVYARPLATA